jgi:hypothetical protein
MILNFFGKLYNLDVKSYQFEHIENHVNSLIHPPLCLYTLVALIFVHIFGFYFLLL